MSAAGAYGGAFDQVLAMRAPIADADVVFSTVDTLGLPLVLLRRARLVAATPVVYASIGLLERVEGLASERGRGLVRSAVAQSALVLAYGHGEAGALRTWLADEPTPPEVRFVPFGVDVEVIRPPGGTPDLDVVSVGNDPRRDWELLAGVADRLHPRTVTAVVAPDALPGLRAGSRIDARAGVPLAETLALLGRARVVALPVRDNLYSGATTVLLQAMALGRPVVVSRTRAVADGYGLVHGKTCLFVPPGDPDAFETAVRSLLDDPRAAEQLGARGRAHVVRNLSWTRYERALADAVTAVAAPRLS